MTRVNGIKPALHRNRSCILLSGHGRWKMFLKYESTELDICDVDEEGREEIYK